VEAFVSADETVETGKNYQGPTMWHIYKYKISVKTQPFII